MGAWVPWRIKGDEAVGQPVALWLAGASHGPKWRVLSGVEGATAAPVEGG